MEFIELALKLSQRIDNMKKEQILKFYQNYKIFIFPVVVTLSCLFLIAFIIYPQTVKLISNQQSEGELIIKSEFLENKVLALESYDEKDLSSKVELVLNVYPGEKDLAEAIGLLQELIAQSGFRVNAISLGNTSQKGGKVQSYDVKLEMIGFKNGFPTLLNDLESSPRLIRVSSIDISSSGNSGAINVSLVVEVLYSQIPQSFGAVDSPVPELSQNDEELLIRLASVKGPVISQAQVVAGPRGKENPFE